MTFKVRESFNRTVAHELGHGAFTWQHPFDEPFKNEQGATRNLMDYVTDDDLAYFQWQSTLGPNLTWGFLEGDEDGMGLFDWYHWIPNDKWLGDNSIDQIKGHEDMMKYIDENRSTWINLKQSQTLDKYTKWTVGNNNDLPSIWLSVKNNKSTTLKDLKAYHIYAYANTIVSETKEVYDYNNKTSDGRFTYLFLYTFQDSPTLTEYRIKDLNDLDENKRVRAYYYGDKYGAIAFYSEQGLLQAILQFYTSNDMKSMTESWATSLLVGKNVDKNETPTQALGHYIVTDENALVRDKDDRSKSTGVKIPYGTEVIIDTSKGEEKIKSSIIVYVKLADSGDEYYTSKSGDEIVAFGCYGYDG